MIRIVIVDDESITRQWVKKKIEDISSEYCIIGVFSNGRQALEFCKNQIVDVIFTDIRMSTMDAIFGRSRPLENSLLLQCRTFVR